MPPATLSSSYTKLVSNLNHFKSSYSSNPLSLAEKILYSHLSHTPTTTTTSTTNASLKNAYLKLNPDRVAMQDASAQMALLQFMLARKKSTAIPSSVHCDHLIEAYQGADKDVSQSLITNKEIFQFLENTSKKYGIDFWKPGSGIIHQIVLENYAFPGGLMLGTDSHTPNAGGLGMLAIGVGGADAVDAMAGIPWELKAPKILGVRLSGKLKGWASPKDVILHLAGKLTVQGGTHHIIEYFGPGTSTLSCTGMATICNMGAEVGATTSVFPFSEAMKKYLESTGRSQIAHEAQWALEKGLLVADKDAKYDKVIDINLSELEPHINGPFTPDAATPLSKFKSLVEERGWKDELKVGLIGSCTNSSYEDMSKAVHVARQAKSHGLQTRSEFMITPGSEQIRATMERDGYTDILTSVGGKVLANACGPCIGQWKRTELTSNQENSILSSFNRNFRGRNDGHSKTMNFLASPEIVTAMAFSGNLSFNPMTDTLQDANGNPFMLEPPQGQELPLKGFDSGRSSFKPTLALPDPSTPIEIDPASTRLQQLTPFEKWSGKEFSDLAVLVKVKGKCTTDHISAAGPWLKYKGHLENISNNTLIGALNAFNDKVNVVTNELSGTEGSIPEVAKEYKNSGLDWVVIADENYGEGSAREHAALQPRFLGCKMIIARSFARIHETNLKKQGIFPATFVDPSHYDLITEGCRLETKGLTELQPGSALQLTIHDRNGKSIHIPLNHTMSVDQIEYFKAGSALNMIAANQ